MHFDGPEYIHKLDSPRLTGQILRIYKLMQDEKWRTLQEIADTTGDPPASVSAQLRHLRKERFGKHTVNKRRRGNRKRGLFEYQLIPHPENDLAFELE
jgi:hypothetical protein